MLGAFHVVENLFKGQEKCYYLTIYLERHQNWNLWVIMTFELNSAEF